MGTPLVTTNFPDLLDPRFQAIWDGEYDRYPDMSKDLFDPETQNGRDEMKFSAVGAFGNWEEFAGAVRYQNMHQGYDVTTRYKAWVSGAMVTREMFDDEQYHVMDEIPKMLAEAAYRTRQGHAARILNNAFSIDTMFYTHSEGVPLASNAHTTFTGASTAEGFDNMLTSELTAVALETAVTMMQTFRGTRAEVITVKPTELWVPPQLEHRAWEILNSPGKWNEATNTANVHKDRFSLKVWNYLTSTQNWFLMDGGMRKRNLKWIDRIPIENAFTEDFDGFVGKYRGYMRYGFLYRDWRFFLGSQVS